MSPLFELTLLLLPILKTAKLSRFSAACSIVISTYDRYEHLLQSLYHYGNSDIPHLDAIFIAWVSD